MKIIRPMMTIRIELLLLLIFLSFNISNGQNNGNGNQTNLMNLIAPAQLLIQVKDGKGSLNAVYQVKKGLKPAIQVTDAGGVSEPISSSAFKAAWGEPKEATKETDLLLLTITIETGQRIEPNQEYTAKIIFLSENFEKYETLLIKDTAEANFSVSPDQLQTVLLTGQSEERAIILSNTGKRKIESIAFSSVNLEDANTHRRIDFNQADQAVGLEPGQEKTTSFKFLQPFYAGTYAGTLNITADQKIRKTIPLTIKTRGPNPFGFAWFPFVLFTVILAAGYFISVLLNNWFEGGGFDRAQAVLQIRQVQKGIDNLLKKIATWEELNPAVKISKIKIALNEALIQIQNELSRVSWRSKVDELKKLAESVSVTEKAGEIYWTTVQSAAGVVSPQNLSTFITKLDAVEIPKQQDQLVNYQTSLTDILNNSVTLTLSGNKSVINSVLQDNLLIEKPEVLIATMSITKWILVALVVFITGYTAFYANDFDFGTLTDYFKVFLWALGLTVTGANVLKSVKTPGAVNG